MSNEIEHIPLSGRIFETKNPFENINPFKNPYFSQNEEGIAMSTYKDINDILIAFRTVATIFDEVRADGKINLEDLGKVLPKIQSLVEQVEDAVQIENPLSVEDLTPDQIKLLFESLIEIIFILSNVEPSGVDSATYKDLKEIFDALTEATGILEDLCEDGKITIMEVPGQLMHLIAFGKAVGAAAKIDGTINLKSLTMSQIKSLLSQLLSDVYVIVASLKKLKIDG